jgi:hypothetical protein
MQGNVRDLAIVRMKIEVVKLGHNFHSTFILSTHILRRVQRGGHRSMQHLLELGGHTDMQASLFWLQIYCTLTWQLSEMVF